MKPTIIFISTLLLSLLALNPQVFAAQSATIKSPIAGDHEERSVDSQVFAYRNSGKDLPRTNATNSDVFLEHPYWEAFNPQTNDWFETTVWPLYPNLSAAENAIFQTEDFIRTSPDGQILVYASNNKLTIANYLTQQIFETDHIRQYRKWWHCISNGEYQPCGL